MSIAAFDPNRHFGNLFIAEKCMERILGSKHHLQSCLLWESFRSLGFAFQRISPYGLSGGIALLGVAGAWWETGSKIKTFKGISPTILWISLSAIIEIFLSALSGRNYVHYFIDWMPLIAFASAIVISRLFPFFVEWSNKRQLFSLSIAIVLMIFYFINVPIQFINSITPLLSHAEITEKQDLVAQYLSIKMEKNQTLLVWGGQAGINFLVKRNSPTPYLFYPLYVPSEITNYISEDFYNRFISHPPAYIVDDSADDPYYTLIPLNTINSISWLAQHHDYNTPYLVQTLEFVQKNYTLNKTLMNMKIYRLNSDK